MYIFTINDATTGKHYEAKVCHFKNTNARKDHKFDSLLHRNHDSWSNAIEQKLK